MLTGMITKELMERKYSIKLRQKMSKRSKEDGIGWVMFKRVSWSTTMRSYSLFIAPSPRHFLTHLSEVISWLVLLLVIHSSARCLRALRLHLTMDHVISNYDYICHFLYQKLKSLSSRSQARIYRRYTFALPIKFNHGRKGSLLSSMTHTSMRQAIWSSKLI